MGVRIQELPETTGINKEDVLIVEDGQGTKKGTVQQLDEALGVSQLKEDLVSLKNNIVKNKIVLELEQGGISGGNNYDGTWEYSQSHYRTIEKQTIESGYNYIISTNEPIKCRISFYDEHGSYIGHSGDFANSIHFNESMGKMFRVAFGAVDDVHYTIEELNSALEFYSEKEFITIPIIPSYRMIKEVSQNLIIDDNVGQDFAAIQGMCFDGSNIWYYLSGLNVLKKYNVADGSTTSYSNLGLGHGNDLTYNPNTQKLYAAFCEGTDPIVKVINVSDMSVETITLSEFDGNIASIAYSADLDKYVVVGGSSYNRSGNTDGWTRKKMIVYDANFDVQKVFTLENDYSACQGIECDDKYIYFCKSYYINETNVDKILVYDFNGKYINSFSPDYGEVESIAKIDDNNFYIARCHSGYSGGYVYKATVSDEEYVSVLEVLFGRYQLN